MLSSGVSSSLSPLTGDWNATPRSLTLRVGAERPDLEAAAVGEDRARPAFEAVQAAEAGEHVEPGAQPQVEGVAEEDLRAHRLEGIRPHAFDAAVGADRHEDRRLDAAVAEQHAAAARQSFGGENVEREHRRIVVAGAARSITRVLRRRARAASRRRS